MNFLDFKTKTTPSNYRTCQNWQYLDSTLHRYVTHYSLDINPDFQREHVWSKQQQIDYIEFKISGGICSNEIYFNCVGWMNDFIGPFVLIDGKQRLNAVMRYLRNEIKAFGYFMNEIEGKLPSYCEFIFNINDLKTRNDILKWYLEINYSGTPHSQQELDRVKQLIIDI